MSTINPLRGVFLDNKYFGYRADSFTENFDLKTSVADTQSDRTVSVNQALFSTFTIQLSLDNTYNINIGSSFVGSTTWLGASRLKDLKGFVGAEGVSMPLVFVCPYGVTYNVVPTGALDIKAFNPDNPDADSMEFRVTLTLEQVT